MSLFGKGSRSAEEPKPAPPPPAGPVPPGSFFHAHKTEAKSAVIGPQVRIQGEVSGDEDITIEGRVEGKIAISKTVKVGPNAQVHAEIKAQTVIVAGKVQGDVTATERVEILPSGSLEGNIRAPKIAIAEGAQFKGSVDMGTQTPAPSPAPVKGAAEPPKK